MRHLDQFIYLNVLPETLNNAILKSDSLTVILFLENDENSRHPLIKLYDSWTKINPLQKLQH